MIDVIWEKERTMIQYGKGIYDCCIYQKAISIKAAFLLAYEADGQFYIKNEEDLNRVDIENLADVIAITSQTRDMCDDFYEYYEKLNKIANTNFSLCDIKDILLHFVNDFKTREIGTFSQWVIDTSIGKMMRNKMIKENKWHTAEWELKQAILKHTDYGLKPLREYIEEQTNSIAWIDVIWNENRKTMGLQFYNQAGVQMKVMQWNNVSKEFAQKTQENIRKGMCNSDFQIWD